MSYPQFGYSYPSPASSLTSSQLLVPGTGLSTTISTTCCDSPRPIMSVSDPTSPNQSVYSPSLLSYPRVAGLPDTVYSSAYATQGYVPFGADPSAFYSPLNHDNTDAWRNLSQTTAWPYDPGMTGYPYSTGYGGLDVRRKNATRESTATLKAWLYEHIKNPYPTKGEKIMLAIITKMTLTQVSTWFANARRRLKKENKMQWSPRNRTGEDDDKANSDDDDDDDIDRDDCHSENKSNDGKKDTEFRRDEDEDIVVDGGNDADSLLAGDTTPHDALRIADESDSSLHHRDKEFDLTSSPIHLSSPTAHLGRNSPDPLLIPPLPKLQHSPLSATPGANSPCHLSLGPASTSTVDSGSPGDKLDHTSEKPRIWSLADVATSSTPPSIRRSSPGLLNHLPKHSAPVYTSSSHNFQHWMNGTSSAHTTGLSYNYSLGHASLTGPGQVGTLPANPRANLGSNCGLPGLGVMSSPNSYTTKLSNGYLGDKTDIPQLTSGFSSPVDDTMTAFKPVAKRL